MEMVKTKVIVILSLAFAAVSCCPRMTWKSESMDGSRTGVVASNAENVEQAFGKVGDGIYYAPNGKTFENGVAPEIASLLIGAQPEMKSLKTVIGYATFPMKKRKPESELTNMFADAFLDATEMYYGRDVDVCILNFGGFRTEIAQGDILMDDIVSMFPFKNYASYVQLEGKDLRKIFEQMASDGPQIISGAKVEVRKKELVSVEIGGKPLADDALYGVSTIDFLLDGGDGYKIARNARDLQITNLRVIDVMLPYVLKLQEEGKNVEYHLDGRFIREK